MGILNLLSIYSLAFNSFHPYYLFCSIKQTMDIKNINIKPEERCLNFGSFLNNQCIDYFNKNKDYKIENLNQCNIYINENENIDMIHKKWTPFIHFIIDFNKFYNTFSTVIDRFSIFQDNMEYINNHNKNLNLSYTLGITNFADLTFEEFSDYIDLSYSVDIGNNICTDQKTNTGNYPSSIDWRKKNAVTPVKDQGQCGSCWSFSTTGAVEGINAITNNKLLSFSEQELVDCSYSYGNHGCNGGLMQNAFTFVHDKGLTTESSYPYTATSSRSSCKSYTPVTFVTGCENVIPNELQLTYAVSQQPVSVSIEADSKSFQLYKSGVYDDPGCGTTLDHGVLAVGYGTEDGKDYWLVKNSWSSGWGESGYIKLARNSIESSTKGMCGIAMDASYPLM